MTDEEIKIRQDLKDDFQHYASKCLQIRTKSGAIEPFILNKAQLYIHGKLQEQIQKTGKVRALILKGRQQGCSSYVGGRFYHKTTHNYGIQCFILTHALNATDNLFKMAQRFYKGTPEVVRPLVSTNNSKELIFGKLDSGYKVGTAENKSVGRSSTIQLFHGCLAKGTFIYDPVNGGIKEIELFLIGDQVLTHTGNLAEISYISIQTKECLSISFRTLTAFPLIATSEHRFWTKEGWKELGELSEGNSIGYPIKEITRRIKRLRFPRPIKRAHGGGSQFLCPREIILSYKFGLLVGLYLAEGHIKRQNKSPFNTSYVLFTVHRKETKRTLEWLAPFSNYFSSINVKHRENSLTTLITIYGSQFSSLLNLLCGRTTKKKFPSQWHAMGREFCRGMIHGYISGDGSSYDNDRRVRVSSICSALTITCRDIIASLGYGWGSIEYKEAGVRHGRNEKKRYTFSLCGHGANKIAEEIDKPCMPIKNEKTSLKARKGPVTTEISDGYAWLRINSISNAGMREVYDFEVDHEDHSYCTVHGASHNSETGFWANASEHAKGILEAVPNALGTEIILESTANGIGNFFHQMWQNAEAEISDYIAIFVPWFWQEEYKTEAPSDFVLTPKELELHELYGLTFDQLAWRRLKIINLSLNGQNGEKSFMQEYPCNSQEAFQLTGEDTYIAGDLVMKARKCKAEKYGPLILGVDPARFGDDRTSVIFRQGRCAFGLQSYTKKSTMEVVGIIMSLYETHKPAKIIIDIGGLGAGVVDRCIELLPEGIVVGINAGSSALDAIKYSNKRAEMWGLTHHWLLDEPCQIPDVDSLHADLSTPKYSFDSNSRLMIERKEDMKKRGIRSSDEADALCLTFALPMSAFANKDSTSDVVRSLMDDFNLKANVLKKSRM